MTLAQHYLPAEAARILGISRTMMARLLQQGKIGSTLYPPAPGQLRGRRYVNGDSLRAYQREHGPKRRTGKGTVQL